MMNSLKSKRIISIFLMLIMVFVMFPECGVTEAEESVSTGMVGTEKESSEEQNIYNNYLKAESFPSGTSAIIIGTDSVQLGQTSAAAEFLDGETVFRMNKGSSVGFSFYVPENGVYEASILFAALADSSESYDYTVMIDGVYPFAECGELSINAIWQDDGEKRELPNGDQINPAQKKVTSVVERPVDDKKGIVLSPYRFSLTGGEHIITVTATEKPFLLSGIRFNPCTQTDSYSDVSKTYDALPLYDGKQITVEAENTLWRNAYSLTAKSDNSSAAVSPRSATESLINYIGGSTWSSPGQEIAWEITVPQDGLYKMGFAFKQNFVNHGFVYRELKIDGNVPFAEAEAVSFPYKTGWQFSSLCDESGENRLIYLTKGTHTLSLAVTLADVAEVFNRLNAIVEPLGDLYLDMVMITGETPDLNRDYELHKQIPEFESTLKNNAELLTQLSDEIGVTLNVNGELRGAIKNMARILKNMSTSLYEAQSYISTYYTAYQTLCAWLYDIMDMSLGLDQIIIAAPDKDFVTPKAGFGESFVFSAQRFFNAFSDEYNSIASSDNSDYPTIKIWVNWGRDQVKVLNTLISENFTPESKINVLVQQVNATLVQGVISGNSPDLYLHQTRTEPVNLAMRGVLYDLKNFDDYEETLTNFKSGAETPYMYHGGCYALPDTQAFYVMFYRTDILNSLGITVPKTWDDFLSATGILQRNKMNVYLPYVRITAATTVNTGAGGLSIFPTMLMQKSGSVYNSEQSSTGLASAASIKAFTFWTDFYTKYSLDQDANFYQKFRVGTMPLGIVSYTQYLTFKVTCPELEGKWKIAEIPGEPVNGEINNICSGSGTGCSIMKSSMEKESAWEFLKWWVSPETQYSYSAETEAILGESGRTATATVDALSRLSWDSNSLEVINSQWTKVREIPEVPGSYFVSRSIDQAFWAVKNKTKSPNEAIVDWSEICDKEIIRKSKEYSNDTEVEHK